MVPFNIRWALYRAHRRLWWIVPKAVSDAGHTGRRMIPVEAAAGIVLRVFPKKTRRGFVPDLQYAVGDVGLTDGRLKLVIGQAAFRSVLEDRKEAEAYEEYASAAADAAAEAGRCRLPSLAVRDDGLAVEAPGPWVRVADLGAGWADPASSESEAIAAAIASDVAAAVRGASASDAIAALARRCRGNAAAVRRVIAAAPTREWEEAAADALTARIIRAVGPGGEIEEFLPARFAAGRPVYTGGPWRPVCTGRRGGMAMSLEWDIA